MKTFPASIHEEKSGEVLWLAGWLSKHMEPQCLRHTTTSSSVQPNSGFGRADICNMPLNDKFNRKGAENVQAQNLAIRESSPLTSLIYYCRSTSFASTIG